MHGGGSSVTVPGLPWEHPDALNEVLVCVPVLGHHLPRRYRCKQQGITVASPHEAKRGESTYKILEQRIGRVEHTSKSTRQFLGPVHEQGKSPYLSVANDS